jgi:hypothetical protein
MMNSTSEAALIGTFCHRNGGLTSAPSHVYRAGIHWSRSKAGLVIAIEPAGGGGSSLLEFEELDRDR